MDIRVSVGQSAFTAFQPPRTPNLVTPRSFPQPDTSETFPPFRLFGAWVEPSAAANGGHHPGAFEGGGRSRIGGAAFCYEGPNPGAREDWERGRNGGVEGAIFCYGGQHLGAFEAGERGRTGGAELQLLQQLEELEGVKQVERSLGSSWGDQSCRAPQGNTSRSEAGNKGQSPSLGVCEDAHPSGGQEMPGNPAAWLRGGQAWANPGGGDVAQAPFDSCRDLPGGGGQQQAVNLLSALQSNKSNAQAENGLGGSSGLGFQQPESVSQQEGGGSGLGSWGGFSGSMDPEVTGFTPWRLPAVNTSKAQPKAEQIPVTSMFSAQFTTSGGWGLIDRKDLGPLEQLQQTEGGGVASSPVRQSETVLPANTDFVSFPTKQLKSSGGWFGVEGTFSWMKAWAPTGSPSDRRDGNPAQKGGGSDKGSGKTGTAHSKPSPPLPSEASKSRAHWAAERAAHELLTLASNGGSGRQEAHPTAQQVKAFAETEGLTPQVTPKYNPILDTNTPLSGTPRAQSHSLEPAGVAISLGDSSSEDDQPLARRQVATVLPCKPPNIGLPVNRLSHVKEEGRPLSGVPSSEVAGDQGPAQEDGQCNYHSGKIKKGWRCKNPKLKGFKICVFHRKQRLDRRQAPTTAAAPSPKPLPGTSGISDRVSSEALSASQISRPFKKRPHSLLGGSSPSPEETETPPPARKRRLPNRPSKRSLENLIEDGVLEGGSAGAADVGGGCGQEALEAGVSGRGESRGGEAVAADSAPHKVQELPDEQRCTYRSGAQGKWRCKRKRHESFKFCQFHRESQKKYWDKKNQARRLIDRKKQ